MRLKDVAARRSWAWGGGVIVVAAVVAVGLTLGVPENEGCGGGLNATAFDESENDDEVGALEGGKADAVSAGYRSGCADPIRAGKYAIKGDIVTPTGVVANGVLVVDGEKIAEIRTRAQGYPAGVTAIADSGGIIFPGLLDGHGHVEYNHIPIADLGKRYQDRDQWPNAALYQTLVKVPKNAVTAAGLQCEALRHGEARALVGGTTAIQGTPQTSCVRSLVRNLEQTNFCRDKVRQNVMGIVGFGRGISGKPSFSDSIKSDIGAGKLSAFVVHAGEGIDAHALAEWQMLKDFHLNVPELVMIHTAAFTAKEYAEVAAAGAKIVWSPLSNLLLYGATANIPAAMKAGVLVSLGADWAPSGSANLLGELKVADHVNKKLWNGVITDEELVQMVTIHPAIAFGMDQELGSLEVGKYADFMIIKKPLKTATQPTPSAYRALIDAKPNDVVLVAIAGDTLFGTEPLLEMFGKHGDFEVIDVCGERRGIDVTVGANDVTRGTETFSDIEAKLKGVNPKLTPIIDCTNDAALKAYAGTALQ
jgi:cytosine/adenosine deaminase-related metal-dependent hydrolase